MFASSAGFCLLLATAVLQAKRTLYSAIGCIVFGFALVAVFSISTIYHTTCIVAPEWKIFLRSLDHCVIYLVIAGTYTPIVCLIVMERGKQTGLGYFVLALEWVSAAAGIAMKLLMDIDSIPPLLSTGYYLFMGWAVLIVIKPAAKLMPFSVFIWTLAGGLCYSFGVAFLLFDSLHFNHGIWHIWVIAGASAHFVAVMLAMTETHSLKDMVNYTSTLLTGKQHTGKQHPIHSFNTKVKTNE